MGKPMAFVAVLAAVVVAAVLAGASSARVDSGRAPQTAKATTVTLSGWSSSPTEEKLLKDVIAAFEASHPNINVDYQVVNGDYVAAMTAKFAARKPPDVFYVDSSVAPDWEAQGVLQPLGSYIKSSHFNTKRFFPRLLSAFRWKGQTYGFPKDWSPLGMETNTTLLRRAGIKRAPTTWKQLTADAKKLKPLVKGGAPLCLDPDWARALAFVYQNKGAWFNASKTKATVNTPAVRGAVNYIVSLLRNGYAKDHTSLGVGWCGEALGKQKSAIAFEGNWIVPYMHSTFPNVKFAVNKLPMGKAHGNLAFTVSYSIGKDSPNKAAAWTLLSYLTGPVGMKKWTSLGLALPARSDVRPLHGNGINTFVSQAGYAHPWQFVTGFTAMYTTANNELQAVFQKKESVSTALKKIQAAAQKALKG
jgi:multiple sugar transport system substrate-binding protein